MEFLLSPLREGMGSKNMTKKEFYLIAIIVVYTYLAILFQINVKNFISFEKNPHAKMSFNLFE